MAKRICERESCSRPIHARQLCRLHYGRWLSHGRAFHEAPRGRIYHRTAAVDRFWPKVSKAGDRGCWLWTAHLNNRGYGQFEHKLAHRLAYEFTVGAIPDGLVLDHLCRTPACVNPAHLEPVTQKENMRRGSFGSRTRCKNGHPYDEANTYHRPDGCRDCRRCRANRERVRQRRIRERTGRWP